MRWFIILFTFKNQTKDKGTNCGKMALMRERTARIQEMWMTMKLKTFPYGENECEFYFWNL